MILLSIIVDLVLIGILVLAFILGLKRGFVKSVSKPVRFFASFATAYGLASPFANGIVVPIIGGAVKTQIKGYLLESCPNITPETIDELPTLLKLGAAMSGTDLNSFTSENIINTIVDALADPVIFILAVIVSFILLYFLSKLFYTIALAIVNSVFKVSVLDKPNKVLGCIINTFAGFCVAWTLTVLFDFFIHLPMFGEWAIGFEGGFIYRFFTMMSPIELLLSF